MCIRHIIQPYIQQNTTVILKISACYTKLKVHKMYKIYTKCNTINKIHQNIDRTLSKSSITTTVFSYGIIKMPSRKNIKMFETFISNE